MNSKFILPMMALVALVSLVGCNRGGGSNEILATVQGQPIDIDNFNSYLGVKQTARVVVQGQVVELPLADTLTFQTMQDLVSRSVLMQMAKEEGVYPSDKEVEDEITFQKNLDPNFLPNYTRRGLTPIQIRDEVRFSLVQEKLITKGITVTDEELETWLKRNPKAFLNPASVELSWILATTENRKQQADEALKSGQKFQDVAVKLSQAPSAPMMQGKYLPEKGPLPIDALAPTLKPAVETGSEGTQTDWIKFTEGWAKFHIDKKNKESNIELTDTRKANVKRNLAIQRGNKANDLRKRLVSKIQTADIVIRREALKEPWKNFETLLKKQAEQAATSSQPVASPNSTGGTGGGETAVPNK